MNFTASAASGVSQNTVIDSLIGYALQEPASALDRNNFWVSKSRQIQDAFQLKESEVTFIAGKGILHQYLDSFYRDFHPLWPMFWLQDLDYGSLHPLLYLTLCSIGAICAGCSSSSFGSLLHEKVRRALLMLPLEVDDSAEVTLDLGRALLLTQVGAVYFEQQHAFSAAQRLGGILTAYAQRMRLFNRHRCLSDPTSLLRRNADAAAAKQWLKKWIFAENCRRLAFGILRAATFMSVLLNTKPLVCYEEIELEFPVSDTIFLNRDLTVEDHIIAIIQEHSMCKGMMFSDVVNIVLDRNEMLPPTQPLEHELVLFGLQGAVWRFSHDPFIVYRLTGEEEFVPSEDGNGFPSTVDMSMNGESCKSDNEKDHLDHSLRRMSDLRNDQCRVFHALQKWKDTFVSSQLAAKHGNNRSLYLSSFLLYHLSLLRLNAPIELLQQLAYQIEEQPSLEEDHVGKIRRWRRCPSAAAALEHACSIWTLIEKESARPSEQQARYNILALIGLHQASVIVWAYAGLTNMDSFVLNMKGSSKLMDTVDLRITRENTHSLLLSFVTLYDRISPAWGIKSSFSYVASRMADRLFPMAS